MEGLLNIIKQDPLFIGLSLLTLLSALGVILEKNIIRAGFSLVICFGGVAGVYFILRAPFVAASQILIYAVGITLIIIFGLMLTSFKQDLPEVKGEIGKYFLSAIVSIGLFLVLSYSLLGNKWNVPEASPICPKNTEVIGLEMLSSYVLPFELISILLLIALIGAIVIAKRDSKNA